MAPAAACRHLAPITLRLARRSGCLSLDRRFGRPVADPSIAPLHRPWRETVSRHHPSAFAWLHRNHMICAGVLLAAVQVGFAPLDPRIQVWAPRFHLRGDVLPTPLSRMHGTSMSQGGVKSGISIEVEPLRGSEDRDGALAAATVRTCAFYGDMDTNSFIDNRFSLFQAVKARQEKGATCLLARIEQPWGEEVLRRICSAAEYRRDVDEAALGRLIDIETRQGLGQLEATTAEEHKISLLEEWGKEIDGRTLFVGAIDVSTHEFETSGTWQEKRRGRGDVYLSDMAVHPKFQRLGIGQLLFSSAVQVAQSQGFLEAHLHVEDVNKGAIDLYRSAGFELAPDDECALDLFRALVFPPPPAPKNILMTKRLSA